MATKKPVSPSTKARAALRKRIRAKVHALRISNTEAAGRMGLSIAQISRLRNDYDQFSLDRLVDAAHGIGVRARIAA